MLRSVLQARWMRVTTSRRNFLLITGGFSVAFLSSLTTDIHNDAKSNPDPPAPVSLSTAERVKEADKQLVDQLHAYSWGSNAPGIPSSRSDNLRLPTVINALSGIPLRDVSVHEKYTALVDGSGDVYVWDSPAVDRFTCVLRGKNVQTVQTSSSKLFALSRSGKIYRLTPGPSDPKREASSFSSSRTSWTSWLWSSAPEEFELTSSTGLHTREKFVSISAGRDHLLALSSSGRTFSHPITIDANSHGQLGTRKIQISSFSSDPSATTLKPGTAMSTIEISPNADVDPYANSSPFIRPNTLKKIAPEIREMVPLLYEIPSLRGIAIGKAVANSRSSYALTRDGRHVLAWGANEYGQLGLGASAIVPVVSVPAEVQLSRVYPGGSSIRCIDILAGGDATYFVVENITGAINGAPSTVVDILACGMGQYGALGNGSYSSAQTTPVKVKTISGNVMFDEHTNTIEPIRPHTFSVSPSSSSPIAASSSGGAHALVSLSSGKDLLAWGSNSSYQLGNGKRANVAVPTYVRDFSLASSAVTETGAADVDHASQGRMTLRSTVVKEVRNLSGDKVGTNVKVQQWPVAGHNSSFVYWRIVD